MTLSAFADRWLREQRLRVKPRTLRSYEDVVFKFLPETLRSLELSEVTRSAIRTALGRKLEDGYAPNTVRHALSVLHILFNAALDEEPPRIQTNPCLRLGKLLPKRQQKHRLAIPREEVPALVRAAQRINPSVGTVVLLGFRSGMRIGEMLALRWQDVDLERRTITVAHADWRDLDATPKGGEVVNLPLSRDAALELEALRQSANEGCPWVFANPETSLPWSRTWVRTVFREALHLCGLPPASIHIARHSFLTHLAEDATDPWVVQQLARHADLKTTQGYVHLGPRGASAVDRLTRTG